MEKERDENFEMGRVRFLVTKSKRQIESDDEKTWS